MSASDTGFDEARLIESLRKEALEVKQCFTQYSFQAIAFCVAVNGLIIEFQRQTPYLGFIAILVVILLLAIARMGTFKYAAASRNLGYELHLQRTARLISTDSNSGWQPYMRNIGWEEAMRAWRIVQASIFEYLHDVTPDKPNKLLEPYAPKRKSDNHNKESPNQEIGDQADVYPEEPKMSADVYRWYLPQELAAKGYPGTSYYAGSYLKEMIRVIKYLIIFSLAPLYAVSFQYAYELTNLSKDKEQNFDWLASAYMLGAFFCAIIAGLFTYWAVRKFSLIQSRREIIEGGFLSIHSCAIVWHIVVVAHHRALLELDSIEGKIMEYSKYTEHLSEQVEQLLPYLENGEIIGDWIEGKPLNSEDSKNRVLEIRANRASE